MRNFLKRLMNRFKAFPVHRVKVEAMIHKRGRIAYVTEAVKVTQATPHGMINLN